MGEPLRYGCVISDPAWRFKDTNTRGAAEGHYKVEESTGRSTMSIAEILALPVPHLSAANAHHFMWTTAAHQYHAHGLLEQWGFTFKLAIPWIKTNDIETVVVRDSDGVRVEHRLTDAYVRKMDKAKVKHPPIALQIGLGHYLRHAHELCLFAVRGSAVAPEDQRNIPNVIFAPRGEHSAKPSPILHEIAELISPGPRLEMFARVQRPGWDVWGNQVANSIDLSRYGSGCI